MKERFKEMNRLCIYLTYDKQKIIDKYIGYMLKELKTCVSYLVVICNEKEVIYGEDILKKYADKIIYRENIGFDVGGFKDALCTYLGWENVLQYEELILVNDSMFGPFQPMKTIFAQMEEKNIDFWGLAKHSDRVCVPEYIQSYFFCIRSRMLHSCQFKQYWESMPFYTEFVDVIQQYEEKFTPYFSSLGYTYDVLADIEANDSQKNRTNNYMQYGMISYELIKRRNFPFLKKQQISYDTLNKQTQENLRQAIDYIDRTTDYDVNLIWDNIIRTLNMADLQRSLHLQYIISSDITSLEQKQFVYEKVAIVVFITYRESAEYVLEYLVGLDSRYSVKIFAESNECLECYWKQGFEGKKIQFDEITELLTDFCDYDFVCVLHDTDMTSDIKSSCIGKSYFYNIWENLIKNSNHILGIMNLFKKESRLGFLASPQPNFAEYFGEYGKRWNRKFNTVQRFTKELHLNCQISEYKEPFRITDNFWIRGCILKKLKNIKAEDNCCLPYIWSYLAQDAGYYSGIVENAEYASMNEVNLQYYLCQITSQVRRQYGNFNNFLEMKEKIFLVALRGFCENYSRILVYGAGEMARYYRNLLSNIEAYVVSDGQVKPDKLDGIPVKYLSEINALDECGIILCLNAKNEMQVIPLLDKHGVKHYFCL